MTELGNSDLEISPRELLSIFWHGRITILLLTLAGAAIGIGASLLSTKMYQATTVVSPVEDESGGNRLSSLVSQMGGLASLPGVSGLPTPTNTKKAEIVAVLQSEAITERYIKDNDLLHLLYPQDWDAVRHAWKTSDPRNIPTLWKANVLFKKKVRFIATDPKSGLVTLVITWKDPVLAAKWANGLVQLTNDFLRDKAIAEAQRNISYLGSEAGSTDVLGVKEAIYSILQNEIQKMMLARGSSEFALKIIDPAVAPEKPSSPQPVMWSLIGLIGGLFASLGVVLARNWLSR